MFETHELTAHLLRKYHLAEHDHVVSKIVVGRRVDQQCWATRESQARKRLHHLALDANEAPVVRTTGQMKIFQ